MHRSVLPLLLGAALAACEAGAPVAPPQPAAQAEGGPVDPAASGQELEVFRLTEDAGGISVTGVTPSPEARAVLLAEIGRRWPDSSIRADVRIDPGAPGMWVPEAAALMPLVARARDAGLVVSARPGPAGGGLLTVTGRVADAAVQRQIASDAVATVAPPFTVQTRLQVGIEDLSTAGDAGGPPIVTADPSVATAGAALRAALGETPIRFEPGSADLAEGSEAALNAVAAFLTEHGDIDAEVAAPAGGSGSSSLDSELAARRASRIVSELEARGLARGRVRPASAVEPPAGVAFTLRPTR